MQPNTLRSHGENRHAGPERTFPPPWHENWPVWLLSVVLVVAAVIDGWKLKVPNWITFPLVVSGWIYSTAYFGWEGLGWSLLGTVVGLALLLPAYAIGGMGAGDVKLLAGVGAWVWATTTLYAFCVSAVVGGVIAVAMVLLATRLASPHDTSSGRSSAKFWRSAIPTRSRPSPPNARARCCCCRTEFRSRLARLPILSGWGCCYECSLNCPA